MNFARPLIYLISDGSLDTQNFFTKSKKLLNLVEVAIQSGVSLIQIREKNLSSNLLFNLTSQIVKISKLSKTKILVNDRSDVALAANADGVHLTSNSIHTKIIRNNFPKGFLIGVSTHTEKEVFLQKNEKADFVVFSPIFFSPNKAKPQGLHKLAKITHSLNNFPIIALGGVDEENFSAVLNSGASGIAAIRLLNDAEKLPELVQKIRGSYEQ